MGAGGTRRRWRRSYNQSTVERKLCSSGRWDGVTVQQKGPFWNAMKKAHFQKSTWDEFQVSPRSICQGRNAWSFISPSHMHSVWRHSGGEGQCSLPGNLMQVRGYHTFIQGQTKKRNSQEGPKSRKLHPALPAYPQDPRNCMHQAALSWVGVRSFMQLPGLLVSLCGDSECMA